MSVQLQDDDLLIAKSLFLSMCREGSETLHRSECDRLAEWVWNHFHKGGTALKQQVGRAQREITIKSSGLDTVYVVLQEVFQLVDKMVGSSYESISLSRFLQWYFGIRQQIDDHRSNQGEWITLKILPEMHEISSLSFQMSESSLLKIRCRSTVWGQSLMAALHRNTIPNGPRHQPY